MKKLYLLQKYFIVSIVFLLCNCYAQSQNIFPSSGSAGIGTITPDGSSLLDMKSTTQGIRIPQMTKTQRDAIATPAPALLIYQTNSTPGFYYYTGSLWKAVTPKASWSLTGNAGTSPTTNFIGTTDAQPLVFRTNNREQMRINASGNVGIGTASPLQKLDVNGNINIITGSGIYFGNSKVIHTTGTDNFFAGTNSGGSIGTGANNTALGMRALASISNGYYNTATGTGSLFSTTDGYYNTASGYYSMYDNIHGSYNTAFGSLSLLSNNGNNNTAIGFDALVLNSGGYSNTAIGANALFSNTTGHNNVAVGDSALYNQSGEVIAGYPTIGSTAVGSKALYSNITGWYNTALGSGSLYASTGDANTASGFGSLTNNAEGSGNTAIGYAALEMNVHGNYNTSIGYHTDDNSNSYSNGTALGANSLITASNQVRVGDNNVTSIGGYQSWTTLPSDKRVKKNIKENVPGLAFINKLKPVTYNIDISAIENIIQRPVIKDKDGKTIQPSQQELDSRKAKEQIVFTGFLAQDVEAAATSLNYDFSGVDKPKNDKDLYGIRYSDFVMPLVKAVQELSAKNDDLQKQIDDLKAMIISSNQNNTATTNSKLQTTNLSSSLAQNIPNPFSNTTTINYSLPQNFSSAQIIITDNSGKVLKQINISGSGKGSVQVNAATISAGAYQYSLLIDGKLIDTKQMILTK